MSTKDQIWDPLRKKYLPLTPEERVRQWFISFLADSMKVPLHMMKSEASMVYGASEKEFRADILVYDRSLSPLLLVECKRPEVALTSEVIEQALRYDMVLNVKYIAITNGENTYLCRKKDGKLIFLDNIPTYTQMLESE